MPVLSSPAQKIILSVCPVQKQAAVVKVVTPRWQRKHREMDWELCCWWVQTGCKEYGFNQNKELAAGAEAGCPGRRTEAGDRSRDGNKAGRKREPCGGNTMTGKSDLSLEDSWGIAPATKANSLILHKWIHVFIKLQVPSPQKIQHYLSHQCEAQYPHLAWDPGTRWP